MPSYQPYCQTWATRLNSKSTMTTMKNHLLRSGFITNGVTISSRDEIITWRFRRKIAAGVFLCRSSLVLSFSLLGGYHLCGYFYYLDCYSLCITLSLFSSSNSKIIPLTARVRRRQEVHILGMCLTTMDRRGSSRVCMARLVKPLLSAFAWRLGACLWSSRRSYKNIVGQSAFEPALYCLMQVCAP